MIRSRHCAAAPCCGRRPNKEEHSPMELEPFVAKPVNPGEPVTSQGWNEIVNGLANVVAFLQATAGTSVRVVISNTDVRLFETRVVAIGANGDVTEAARPVGASKEFTLRGLAPGAYTIRSESPGFAPAQIGRAHV